VGLHEGNQNQNHIPPIPDVAVVVAVDITIIAVEMEVVEIVEIVVNTISLLNQPHHYHFGQHLPKVIEVYH
jgi:hypothetical protein